MKLDKIKFAKVIWYLTWHCKADMNIDDLGVLDSLIDIDVTPVEIPGKANPADVNELMRLMAGGRKNGTIGTKIEAIRMHRQLTGCMLKESKDAVERYWVSPEAEQQPARLKDIDVYLKTKSGDSDPVNFDKFEG